MVSSRGPRGNIARNGGVPRGRALFVGAAVMAVGLASGACDVQDPSTPARPAHLAADPTTYAVGPQYDTTHVYVSASDMDAFLKSWTDTFGGTVTPAATLTVTPTPSVTRSQLVKSPVGTLSVFAFSTPIPAAFGTERGGLYVRDFQVGLDAARGAGATTVVDSFPDPVGRDAIVAFPGGINAQLYWHTSPSSYPPLVSVPENRVYLTPDDADQFLAAYSRFTGSKTTSDTAAADGAEIGRAGYTFRRVALTSAFGNALVIVTDGKLPFPYGKEVTGYNVQDLQVTLRRAAAAGARVLAGPVNIGSRMSAMVSFPGGYIAELHSGM